MESKKDQVQIDETKLRRLQFRVFNLEKQNVGPNGLKANERVKKIKCAKHTLFFFCLYFAC